jgi:hypothetical protein
MPGSNPLREKKNYKNRHQLSVFFFGIDINTDVLLAL